MVSFLQEGDNGHTHYRLQWIMIMNCLSGVHIHEFLYYFTTDELLATTIQGTSEDLDSAVASSRAAYESWSKLPGHVRARHLYSVARHVQKHARYCIVSS